MRITRNLRRCRRIDSRIKAPKIVEIAQGSRPCMTLYQKVEIIDIFGATFPPVCTDWREILHSQADPGACRQCKVWPESVQRVNGSPLRGEKPDFWPVSKNNTGSLPLRGNPAGKNLSV